MQKVKTFQDLKVWQKAHALVLDIYKATKGFPAEEKFGLISQLRRSSSSVAANIVEGHARKSRKDFLHFLNLAEGSLEEAKYLLVLSKDLDYLPLVIYEKLNKQCEEVGKMLYGFQKGLNAYRLKLTAE